MGMEAFDYIKPEIENRIQKQLCNLHKELILPEERLKLFYGTIHTFLKPSIYVFLLILLIMSFMKLVLFKHINCLIN